MEQLILTLGVLAGAYKLLVNKETFIETFLDSEQAYKQKNVSVPDTNGVIYSNGNNINFEGLVASNDFLANIPSTGNQKDFIKQNNLHNNKLINGIPIKDYYEKYTNDVLNNGKWFLNKDMPQETKQYDYDNIVNQRKMELATGMLQKSDRALIGIPNKKEIKSFFTPDEQTTGYGYQYGKGGPGYNLSRQKELEEYKDSLKFKTNEIPFEQIKVGRGIAVDAEVPAAGGFQQYTRVMPDNVSDYRANQLPGVVTGGKWQMSNAPTSVAPVAKNHPNGYYSLCQVGPVAGKSVVTAPTNRPDVDVLLRNTNRGFINYGMGPSTGRMELNSYLN